MCFCEVMFRFCFFIVSLICRWMCQCTLTCWYVSWYILALQTWVWNFLSWITERGLSPLFSKFRQWCINSSIWCIGRCVLCSISSCSVSTRVKSLATAWDHDFLFCRSSKMCIEAMTIETFMEHKMCISNGSRMCFWCLKLDTIIAQFATP